MGFGSPFGCFTLTRLLDDTDAGENNHAGVDQGGLFAEIGTCGLTESDLIGGRATALFPV